MVRQEKKETMLTAGLHRSSHQFGAATYELYFAPEFEDEIASKVLEAGLFLSLTPLSSFLRGFTFLVLV